MIFVLVMLGAAAWLLATRGVDGIQRVTTMAEEPAAGAHDARAVRSPTEPPAVWGDLSRPFDPPWLGFALNVHHIDRVELYLDSVDRIAAAGANALVVLSPMYVKDLQSEQIRFIPSRCARDEELIAILSRGKQRGLRTMLIPLVLPENPRGKEWRGLMQPSNWDRWWVSYRFVVDRFIGIANRADVDILCIGSELNSVEPQIDQWQEVIAHARDRFKGLLSYSANWDRFKKVEFWDDLDLICVSSYFELIDDEEEDPTRKGAPPPTVEVLADTWRKERDSMLEFARSAKKPMIISEVGYPSLPWAAEHPWNYVAPAGTSADHAAQARCWAAFFTAWTETFLNRDPSAGGVLCYHWDPYYHGESKDTGYGVDGKPALEIIERAFRVIAQAQSETVGTKPPSGE